MEIGAVLVGVAGTTMVVVEGVAKASDSVAGGGAKKVVDGECTA